MIRKVMLEDKTWVLDTAEKVYSGSKFGWVREDAEKTFDWALNNNNCLFIRHNRTFLFAFLSRRLCDYSKFDAYMELLVGEGRSGTEPLGLLQVFKQWGIMRGADRLTISSVTQHRFGKLIMKKLGASPRIIYDINTI